jgi:radical SAM protein with 4Fe4S-binding SPASM domain
MRTTYPELDRIAEFCRQRTKDYYRFDPLLRLRFDGDVRRNAVIRSERLTPTQIVAAERADDERLHALQTDRGVHRLGDPSAAAPASSRLFPCKAGVTSFTVGYDGTFRLCTPLWHPDTIYDLRGGTLRDAWERWVPGVREVRTGDLRYLSTCGVCPIRTLCLMCPAHAALETGAMDAFVPYFCEVAHARFAALEDGG